MNKFLLAAAIAATLVSSAQADGSDILPPDEALLFAEGAAVEIQEGYAVVSCSDLWNLWNHPSVKAQWENAVGTQAIAWEEIRTTFAKACDMYPFSMS